MQKLEMNPMEPIDFLALLALLLMLVVMIMAIRQSYADAKAHHQAYELVDTTFASVWDGDRNLELYAWTLTKAKLHGCANPYINEVISHRLREFHQKAKAVRMDGYPSPNNQSRAIWAQSSTQIKIKKPTI